MRALRPVVSVASRIPSGFAQQLFAPCLLRALPAPHTCVLPLQQQPLDRLVAQAAELHLTAQIVAHVFNDHEEADDEQHPDHPGAQHHDLLAVGEREHERQNGRHDEAGEQRAALELRVQFRETARTVLDHIAVAALVGQHLDGLGHGVAAFRQLHLLADDHVACLDFPGEQAVEIGQQRANHQSDEERGRGEQQQRADLLQPMAVVHARDGLAERVDRIAERHQRVYHAEELRHHLDGVQAGCARNLHDHQRHAQSLAHMHECGGQRIGDAQIHQRGDDAGQHERWRVRGLHAEHQVADGAHRALDGAHGSEQQVACQIFFGGAQVEVFEALIIHLHLEDHHERERAHPQGEVGQ